MPDPGFPPRHDVDLSVLFVTYNRSDLLETAYTSIQERMDFGALRVEYIVTDDRSDPAHVRVLENLHFDKRVLWSVNSGLGANCNRGIAACHGEYILQIQDDCEFVGSRTLLATGLEIMETDPEIGILQLTNQTPAVPHEVRHLANGTPYLVFVNDGEPYKRDCGARPYSDQPHLKRRQFIDDVGPYTEGVPMTSMESRYQQRVACQARWKVAHLPQGRSFSHLGAGRSFNDSLLRAARLERIESLSVLGAAFRRSRPYLKTLRALSRSIHTAVSRATSARRIS
jgi:glycosyltransferase involved in cell wall biosynthesis